MTIRLPVRLVAVACLLVGGVVAYPALQHVPCEAQAWAIGRAAAQEPAPAPSPADDSLGDPTAPRPELAEANDPASWLTIEVPAEPVPLGDPIELKVTLTPPANVKAVPTILATGVKVRKYGDGLYYGWAKPGEQSFAVKVNWGKTDLSELGDFTESETFTVGDPPPPKPLSELAGVHVKSLSDWYFAQLDAAAYMPTPGAFHTAHAGKLAALGLTGSDYAKEVVTRFAKIGEGDWPLPLITALKAVGKELGQKPPEPPTPPTPPVVTATKLWLIAIDDAETRTPQQTLLLSDVPYWNAQKAKGHEYEWYQTGSVDASRFAAFIRFPDELVVQDADTGKVLGVEELSAAPTKAWADLIIAKYSGAK